MTHVPSLPIPSLDSVLPLLLPYLDAQSRLTLRRTSKALARDVWQHCDKTLILARLRPRFPARLRAMLSFKASPAQLLRALVKARRPSFVPLGPTPTWLAGIRAVTLGPADDFFYHCCPRLQASELLALSALPGLQRLELRYVHIDSGLPPPTACLACGAPRLPPPPLLRLHTLACTSARPGSQTLAAVLTVLDCRLLHTLIAHGTAPYALHERLPGLRVLDTAVEAPGGGGCIDYLCGWRLLALMRHGGLSEVHVGALRLSDAPAWTDRGSPRIGRLVVETGADMQAIAALPLDAIAGVTVKGGLRLASLLSPEALGRLEDAAATGRLRLQAKPVYNDQHDMGTKYGEPVFTIDYSAWAMASGGAEQLRRWLRPLIRCLAGYSCSSPGVGARHTLVLKGYSLRGEGGCEEALLPLQELPCDPPWSLCLYDCPGVPPEPQCLFDHLPESVKRVVVTHSPQFVARLVLDLVGGPLGVWSVGDVMTSPIVRRRAGCFSWV